MSEQEEQVGTEKAEAEREETIATALFEAAATAAAACGSEARDLRCAYPHPFTSCGCRGAACAPAARAAELWARAGRVDRAVDLAKASLAAGLAGRLPPPSSTAAGATAGTLHEQALSSLRRRFPVEAGALRRAARVLQLSREDEAVAATGSLSVDGAVDFSNWFPPRSLRAVAAAAVSSSSSESVPSDRRLSLLDFAATAFAAAGDAHSATSAAISACEERHENALVLASKGGTSSAEVVSALSAAYKAEDAMLSAAAHSGGAYEAEAAVRYCARRAERAAALPRDASLLLAGRHLSDVARGESFYQRWRVHFLVSLRSFAEAEAIARSGGEGQGLHPTWSPLLLCLLVQGLWRCEFSGAGVGHPSSGRGSGLTVERAGKLAEALQRCAAQEWARRNGMLLDERAKAVGEMLPPPSRLEGMAGALLSAQLGLRGRAAASFLRAAEYAESEVRARSETANRGRPGAQPSSSPSFGDAEKLLPTALFVNDGNCGTSTVGDRGLLLWLCRKDFVEHGTRCWGDATATHWLSRAVAAAAESFKRESVRGSKASNVVVDATFSFLHGAGMPPGLSAREAVLAARGGSAWHSDGKGAAGDEERIAALFPEIPTVVRAAHSTELALRLRFSRRPGPRIARALSAIETSAGNIAVLLCIARAVGTACFADGKIPEDGSYGLPSLRLRFFTTFARATARRRLACGDAATAAGLVLRELKLDHNDGPERHSDDNDDDQAKDPELLLFAAIACERAGDMFLDYAAEVSRQLQAGAAQRLSQKQRRLYQKIAVKIARKIRGANGRTVTDLQGEETVPCTWNCGTQVRAFSLRCGRCEHGEPESGSGDEGGPESKQGLAEGKKKCQRHNFRAGSVGKVLFGLGMESRGSLPFCCVTGKALPPGALSCCICPVTGLPAGEEVAKKTFQIIQYIA